MTPRAVQTPSCNGIAPLKAGVVRTTRALAAPKIPNSAQSIHAGKKAPNNSNEGAPPREQPESMQLIASARTALRSDGWDITLATHQAENPEARDSPTVRFRHSSSNARCAAITAEAHGRIDEAAVLPD